MDILATGTQKWVQAELNHCGAAAITADERVCPPSGINAQRMRGVIADESDPARLIWN